ncbi:MAG: hypothetical protein ACRCZ2_06855 [Fusobacteriaceae bacterium]
MWRDNRYTIKWYENGGTVQTFSSDTLLKKVGNLSEKIDPRKSSINTITFDFEVDNPADEFTKFMYNKLSTKGKMFFREVVEVQKGGTTIYKGFVRSVKVNNALETGYSISLENIIGKLKTSLWDREFSEYTNETTAIINSKRLSGGFSMIDNPDGTRTMRYSGHIMYCLSGMFQMLLSKPQITVNTTFLDNNCWNFLDWDNFNSIKNDLDSSIYNVYFEWKEPISNVFEFLQEQIFQAVGVVPIVNAWGKLEMKIHQQPTVAQGITVFTEENTLKFNSKTIDESQVVNYLKMDYVKDVKENEYIKSLVKINSGSFEFFGNELIPERPQKIKVDCINNHSRADQVAFCSNIADRLFSRYSREINIISIKVPIQLGYKVKVADFIGIDFDQLVDWVDGTRGFGLEVDSQAPYCKFNIGDEWGGFIEGNTMGIGADGTEVVTTTMSVIDTQNFRDTSNGSIKSFIENHNNVRKWVDTQ